MKKRTFGRIIMLLKEGVSLKTCIELIIQLSKSPEDAAKAITDLIVIIERGKF